MRALHSSSALAVNFFDYWTDRDKTPILSALGIDSEAGIHWTSKRNSIQGL